MRLLGSVAVVYLNCSLAIGIASVNLLVCLDCFVLSLEVWVLGWSKLLAGDVRVNGDQFKFPHDLGIIMDLFQHYKL